MDQESEGNYQNVHTNQSNRRKDRESMTKLFIKWMARDEKRDEKKG